MSLPFFLGRRSSALHFTTSSSMLFSFQRAMVVVACLCLLLARSSAADMSVAELIQASKSGAEASRIKAIDQPGARGEKGSDALPTLMQLLSEGSAAVRAHAANALGGLGSAAKPAAAALISLA